jgi:hypothetical protein
MPASRESATPIPFPLAACPHRNMLPLPVRVAEGRPNPWLRHLVHRKSNAAEVVMFHSSLIVTSINHQPHATGAAARTVAAAVTPFFSTAQTKSSDIQRFLPSRVFLRDIPHR